MSARDLLSFYEGGNLRDRFKPVESEIESLGSASEENENQDMHPGMKTAPVKAERPLPSLVSAVTSPVIKNIARKCGKCGRIALTGVDFCVECGSAVEN
jgi:hypothetical protein